MNVLVKIYPWESPRVFRDNNLNLKGGDKVIVGVEREIENGKVVAVNVKAGQEEGLVLRRANVSDLELIERYQGKEKEALGFCQTEIRRNELPMKLTGVHFSFDGSKIIFSFTAGKRVDFRNLIKALSQHFQRSVRLQQIGSRDEARMVGGLGICGRELCCRIFNGNLRSVTAENARIQQLGQRGSDRISGLCGRLRCCLSYESEQYKEASIGFQGLRSIVTVDGEKGKIIERHVLAREVTVEFEDRTRKRIEVKDIKN